MQSDDFEGTFGNFLDKRVYDDAENALFSVVRAAFLAGWEAAKREAIEPSERNSILNKE